MFRDEAFQVMICVLWFDISISGFWVIGMLGGGGGCEYSGIGSVHFNVSFSSSIGRYGN